MTEAPMKPSEGVSYIGVSRPRGGWCAVLRSFKIDIDGTRVGSVGPGESITFTVSPGRHLMRARLDWSRSHPVELELAAGETAQMICGTVAWESLLAAFTLGLSAFPNLKREH